MRLLFSSGTKHEILLFFMLSGGWSILLPVRGRGSLTREWRSRRDAPFDMQKVALLKPNRASQLEPRSKGSRVSTKMAGNQNKSSSPKTIVFLHPDLGIGGAERLVVDAAVGLQKQGHKVVIFTSHCDPKHCFDEARDGTSGL